MALAAPSIERSWNQTVLSYVCQLPYNQANPVSKRKIFVGGEGEMRGGSHVYIANLVTLQTLTSGICWKISYDKLRIITILHE